MARALEVSSTRRLLMQTVMWIILAGTVGLAAMVSHFRRTSLEVKLESASSYRGLSVQLPKGWVIDKSTDPQSSVLITATESSGKDEEDASGRVIRIVREPLATFRSPMEFALSRMAGAGGTPLEGVEDSIAIDGSPGLMLAQSRRHTIKLQDLIAGGRMPESKMICAATVGTSGKGVGIELEGPGKLQSHDVELVRRIAASIKLQDEPPFAEDRQVQVGEVRVPVPADFSALKIDDSLISGRVIRTTTASAPMRMITLLPLVMLPKDGTASLLTSLSLYEPNLFSDAVIRQDNAGFWRIEADTMVRRSLPIAAFAITKNGAGLIAVLRGGDDDSWMENTWQAIRENLSFPENDATERMLAAGAEAAKSLRENGLTKLLPEAPDELYWLMCVNGPDRPVGWLHYTPGATGGKISGRLQFDRSRHQIDYEWFGGPDLKKYATKIDYSMIQLQESQLGRKDMREMSTSLKGDKIELSPGSGKAISYSVPPNFVPGGWLPLVMGKISDRPLILRIDSFFDYAYAQPTDLLTVIIRPEPRPRSEENPAPGVENLKCVTVEFSGSGEKSRWFLREDGSIETIEYPQSQRLIRRDKSDISVDFFHNEPMRP